METMRERRAAGRLFTDKGEGLPEERLRAKSLAHAFNRTHPTETGERETLLREMFGGFGSGWIEPPLNVCYGVNTFIGEGFYANVNLTLIDDWTIHIGDKVLLGPNVTIAVTGHGLHPDLRQRGETCAFPVRIGNCVWIGAGVIVCPGVTIGDNVVIGAGSIVTRDIPADTIAVGNPCRALRAITDEDRAFYFRGQRVD